MSSDSATASPAGEAATDEGEGEQALADRGILGGRGLGEVRQDAVAHGGRLLDLLEADRVLREARDGQQAGDGTEADDQVVVGDLELLVLLEVHHHGVLGAADRGDRAGDDLRARQHLAQGRQDVARIDAAGADLGEEGRVRHVRTRVDDGDRDLRAESLAQLGSGRQTDGTASQDEDMGLAAEGISHIYRVEL